MIIDNLYLVDVTFLPTETDTPLVVDANAVLPLAIGLQCLQVITGRNPQIPEHSGTMEEEQLTPRRTFNGPEPGDRNVVEEVLGILAPEGLNHSTTVLCWT